ncbi:hypothetical protein GC175_14260 [bacterium]|nr:hypothetical protein [bacterium]
MQNEMLISSIGLILSIVPVTIHGIEALLPMQARWIVNWVLPFFGVVAVLMMLVNANHAGIPFLGNHPKVSPIGKNVGIVFTPFWLVVAVLNWLAFYYSLS